jgi:hypothetical protein
LHQHPSLSPIWPYGGILYHSWQKKKEPRLGLWRVQFSMWFKTKKMARSYIPLGVNLRYRDEEAKKSSNGQF